MANLVTTLPVGRQQFFNANGAPLAGGSVAHYTPGTLTPVNTWQDYLGTVLNANPLTLDSAGSCQIYGTGSYRQIVKDSGGNTIYDQVVTAIAQIAGLTTLKTYGAIGDGVTNDAGALAATFAAVSEAWVTPGTYLIGTNTTIGNGTRLRIMAGAQFSVPTGVTLTIRGAVEAPPNVQIFSGAGSVVGIRQVYPEWWGALGNGTGNDQPAFALAHTCVQGSLGSDGGRPTIFLTRAQYQFATTWVITPTANINLAVRGNDTISSGVRIVASSSFSPAGAVIQVDGNTNVTQAISDWELTGIGIVPSGGGAGAANIALQIGSTSVTKFLDGLQMNKVEDVYIGNFSTGLLVVHARLIEFNRVSVWNNGLSSNNNCILIEQAGGFTGDLTFNDCQWVNTMSSGREGLVISSTVGPWSSTGGFNNGVQGEIAGIRFNGCIGYNCDQYVQINTTAGSFVHDIWFNAGCQFDGGAISSINLTTSGSGSLVENVHFDHVYCDGATGNMITVAAGTGAKNTNIWVTDNWLAQAQGCAVIVGSAGTNTGIHINGNAIKDCANTSGPAIEVSNTVGAEIIGNVLTSSAGATVAYAVELGTGCNYLTCIGNNSGGVATSSAVLDSSGTITKAVANNI